MASGIYGEMLAPSGALEYNPRSRITMAKSLSDHLGVDHKVFASTGAFDAILDVDSLLFIDPHLLAASKAPEIACSYQTVLTYFKNILTVLSACQSVGDPFWRQADRLFTFPELKGLCIGYSGKGTSGSGMGPDLRRRVLTTAKAITDAGVANPELFELIGVFEEDIGPDRISDMVGKIIVKELLAYTSRILTELGAQFSLISYRTESYRSIQNPYNHSPVIMVPRDILRDLPVAKCWSDIDVVCAENQELRNRVNKIIGNTWKTATRQKKQTLKDLLIAEPEVVTDLITLYKKKPALQYDFDNDPAGEVAWYKATQQLTRQFPLALWLGPTPSSENVLGVVLKICEKFKDLIENNGLCSLLYDANNLPKHESAAQKLFYGIADTYCEANELDLSRESNAGRGPVDFKVSQGYSSRVVVEAKLTTNPQLVHGFTTQLSEYQKAEKTRTSVYLVVDVGGPTKRINAFRRLLKQAEGEGRRVPLVVFIDGTPKASASKFKSED